MNSNLSFNSEVGNKNRKPDSGLSGSNNKNKESKELPSDVVEGNGIENKKEVNS